VLLAQMRSTINMLLERRRNVRPGTAPGCRFGGDL